MHKGLARTGVVLLAILIAAPAAAARGAGEARKAYDEATAAFGLGRYTEAAEKYETAFGLRPDPALLYDAAQAYRLGGNRTRALELYRNYVRLYPSGANADEARSQAAALAKAIDADKQAPTPNPTPLPTAPPPVVAPALPPAVAPPPSETVAASLSSRPAAEPAAPASGSHLWIWVAVGAAAVVAGSVALVLATRSDKFPDASFGSAPGN
jgi:tetratricopeptide (TPR) repeat protein